MWNKVYDSEYLLNIFDILSMFVNTTSFTFSTPNDYIYGNWVGNNSNLDENCTNPKGLYESIISKPENLYWSISYRYFDGNIPYLQNMPLIHQVKSDHTLTPSFMEDVLHSILQQR